MRRNGRSHIASGGVADATPALTGVLWRWVLACILTAIALTACATPAPNPDAPTPAVAPTPTASAAIAIPTATIASASTASTPIAASPIASPTPAITPAPTASAPIATPTTPAIAPAPTDFALIATLAPPNISDATDAATTSARLSQAGMAYLTAFTERFSPRESGTHEERIAAEFLAAEMRQLGYDVLVQPLTAEIIDRSIEPVSIVSPEPRALRSRPLGLSGAGNVSAPLAFAGKALAGDIPAGGLAGRIALIERGDITFEEKTTRAAKAGALGAIIYNNAPGEFGGTLMHRASIPAASISRADGLALLESLDGGMRVEAHIRVVVERRGSQNIIAEKRGAAADGGVVVLGAHYDTVPESQGAGDNGTGVAALMLMAQALAHADFPFTLRFILFGVEEIGLHGSRHYVENLTDAELSDIIAMLNFDAMGAGNAGILGDAALVDAAIAIAAENRLDFGEADGMRRGGSDHAPFRDAGVSIAFFFGDDFSRINSPDDALEFVDPSIMGTHMTVALRLLHELASDSR